MKNGKSPLLCCGSDLFSELDSLPVSLSLPASLPPPSLTCKLDKGGLPLFRKMSKGY